MIRSKCLLFLAWVSLVCPPALMATHPQRIQFSTAQEFLKGDFQGISVSSEGRLILAPSLEELFDTEQPFIYSAALNQAGELFVGTGSNGKIFKITGDGSGSEFTTLPESGVYAMAVDSQNRLLAATSPDGKIYRIDTQGEESIFYDPDEKYIWTMVPDSDGGLYVGTGPQGIIYRVDAQGNGKVFYDSSETHIMSLDFDLENRLLAGTAPGGLLIRLSSSGQPFVLYDSALEEVKAITVDRYGVIYAGALSSGPPSPPSNGEQAVSTPESTGTSSEATESTVEISGTAKGGRLEVYRIGRDLMVETIYSSADQIAFDLLVRDDGNLLVATGDEGRILSVSPQRFTTLLVDSMEQQVTRILEHSGDLYAITSNLGKVLRVTPQPAEKGSYESEPIDAEMIAEWGVLRWAMHNPTNSNIEFFTRSGNTAQPDQTWSEWEGPYTENSASIESPPTRYLQWKVDIGPESRSGSLLSQTNAIDMVTVSYMQRNIAPELRSVTIYAPGVALMKFPPTNQMGVQPGGPDGAHARSLPRSIRDLDTQRGVPPPRKIYSPGARSFSWEATDANDDDLTFSIYLRREGESNWRLLKEGVEENNYTLDGASYPDGTYFLRVVASDGPGNPPDRARQSELISRAFTIANSGPEIETETPQIHEDGATISFSARVQTGSLYQGEYSLDGVNWVIVFPEDGIADETEEEFSFSVSNLESGLHIISLRVVDSNGNLSVSRIELSIP